MIKAITDFDSGLAKVATAIAAQYFPEITDDWRIGVLAHQPVLESARLFEGTWPVGRLNVVSLPCGERYFANVGHDVAPVIEAYGVVVTAGAVCLRPERVILICITFDLRGAWIQTAFIHELCHGITPALPPHGPNWAGSMKQKAAQARRAGAGDLADLLLADVERHAVADFPRVTDALGYTVAWLRQRAEHRQQAQIMVEGGTGLAQWLAARRGGVEIK
jgi:hypothetical protein